MTQKSQIQRRGKDDRLRDSDPQTARRLNLAVETCEHPLASHTGFLNDIVCELHGRERLDQLPQGWAGSDWVESLWNEVVSESGNDRLISSLSRALEAAEPRDDASGVYRLRLALAIKLLEIRAEPIRRDRAGKQREIRPLQKWRLRRVTEYVDGHLSNRITLLDMAAVAGLSRMHFASQFRVATGVRPHEFLLRRRVRRAQELLQNTTMSIVEIALTVGFQTQAHLTTVFKQFVSCTPGRWRAIKTPPIALPFRTRDIDLIAADVE
jgi:AraC family transcriptional regulator